MENAIINGYVLKYKLGDGGMADVWYAENSLRKPAAIKVLLKKLCDEPDIVARFQNEARLMVQLNHPHIRNIQDYGIVEQRPCMIMEYLEGSDLSVQMKSGTRFNSNQLVQWWNNLVDALQYTHRKHIIHRDIKPSNLFLTESGEIKLLDFGVAKIKDNITVTQTGSRMGTLMYMSPEQVYDVKNLTYKTDIYSLAVTFYHLIVGQPPYDSSKISDFEIQESIVRKNIDVGILPLPWRELLPDYFAKNPEERKELRKINESQNAYTGETIYINPQQERPQKQKVLTQSKYTLPQEPRRSPFYFLFPIFVILGLIVFALNKDKVQHFFNKEKSSQTTTGDKKKAAAKPKNITSSKEKQGNHNDADTINSKADDGNNDQVIVRVRMSEDEVKAKINDYYRSRGDCSSLSRFFADTVKQYYNKSNEPLTVVKKECEAYHGKWKFTEADIDDNSYVFTYNQNGKIYVDFNMTYKIKQNVDEDWIPYNIDVAMVISETNKIERIVERRIEKL